MGIFRGFRDVFGFKPCQISKSFREKEWVMVDAKLTQLAKTFFLACKEEERERGRPAPDVSPGAWNEVVKERMGFLRQATDKLLRAKKDFWQAHKLAKKAGYTVYKNFLDYLPPDYKK